MEIRKFIATTIREYLAEGTINDFKYDAVKKQVQQALNNGGLSLDDISSDRYFIVCFGFSNQYISTVSVLDKQEAISNINHYKNDDNIWKIYVEKPNVDAIVYLRKEWGWEKK
jgi:hypothetical protein